jgi:hypothetical protein
MKPLARVLGLLAAGLVLAGCTFEHHGDDSIAKQFGADHVGMGGSVNLTDTVDGDAFLAGGRVETAAEVKGDLVAAGGEVSIGGGVGDDLYAAGGQVRIDAIVSGNARVAGGDVALGPATVVVGALTATGGRLRFEGNAHQYLRASGGSVHIDGVVQGDAEVSAEEITIGPHTRIAGKLVARTSRMPTVPAGAQIAGGIEFQQADVGHVIGADDDDGIESVAHGVGSFFWMLGVFVAGALFMLAFPGYSARAARWIGQEPLRSLGLGFVILVSLPVLTLLLAITIIGLPLALIVGMLYLLLLFLGWVTAAMFVGQKLLGWVRRDSTTETTGRRLLALLAAVLALWAVGFVPILGFWVRFAALLLGIGALVWQGWPRREGVPQPA